MLKQPLAPGNQQLALGIRPNDHATLSDFCWHGNTLLQQHLFAFLNGSSDHMLYLWGHPGSGKSHLLQGCCHAVQTNETAVYLPLSVLCQWEAAVLEGIETQRFIAIDDIDAIATQHDFEEALFHLYNRVRDNGQTKLIITGNRPPSTLPVQLPDLRSRLSWGQVLQVLELSDEAKIHTLQLRAKQRGFLLPDPVGRFLLKRATRNMHDLLHLLNLLDEASLAAQRRLTIPFVKTVLSL